MKLYHLRLMMTLPTKDYYYYYYLDQKSWIGHFRIAFASLGRAFAIVILPLPYVPAPRSCWQVLAT